MTAQFPRTVAEHRPLASSEPVQRRPQGSLYVHWYLGEQQPLVEQQPLEERQHLAIHLWYTDAEHHQLIVSGHWPLQQQWQGNLNGHQYLKERQQLGERRHVAGQLQRSPAGHQPLLRLPSCLSTAPSRPRLELVLCPWMLLSMCWRSVV